jgi:hypothetical protein
MNLFRSICRLLVVDARRKELSPPKELGEVKHPAISAKREPNERRPAKTSLNTWRAGQLAHPVEGLNRLSRRTRGSIAPTAMPAASPIEAATKKHKHQ